MALQIKNKITDQLIVGTRYFYLYEDIPILVSESNLEATKITIDILVRDVNDNTLIKTLSEYAVYDINPGKGINIDLMRIIQQAHNADVWKIGSAFEIPNKPETTISPYKYDINIYSDLNTSNTLGTIGIIPILGGRRFMDFKPLVLNNFPLTEFEALGVPRRIYDGYPNISQRLMPPNVSGQKLITSTSVFQTGICASAGMLFWKSRLGGWMQWGFDIRDIKKKFNYENNIEVGGMDTLRDYANQQPFVPTNYGSVNYTHTMTLKTLSLTQGELEAVSSISESPVCYYMKPVTITSSYDPRNSRLELYRISSVSAPQNSLANGGDFSVSLKNISTTGFKTR